MIEYTQNNVDEIVARARELGAEEGLTYKNGHLQLETYVEPHGAAVLAMLIINGWHDKYDLIYAVQAVIEYVETAAVINLMNKMSYKHHVGDGGKVSDEKEWQTACGTLVSMLTAELTGRGIQPRAVVTNLRLYAECLDKLIEYKDV